MLVAASSGESSNYLEAVHKGRSCGMCAGSRLGSAVERVVVRVCRRCALYVISI